MLMVEWMLKEKNMLKEVMKVNVSSFSRPRCYTQMFCLCIDILTLPPPPLEVSPTIGGIAWGKAGWLHSTTTLRLAPLQSILEPTFFRYYEV